MTRTKKTILGGVVFLLVIVVASVIFIATFDFNRLKPRINATVSEALHRPFAINGDLGVQWARQQGQVGWRGWIPWPHLHAEDVVLGNPAEIPGDYTARLSRVEASISPLALLHKEVYLPRITLVGPDAELKRLVNGKNNWTFNLVNSDASQQNGPPSAWSFEVDDIVFDQAKMVFSDPLTQADIHITLNPLGKPVPFAELAGETDTDKEADVADYIFGWEVSGKYNNQPLSGEGKMGGMLALRSANTPFPVQADVRSGETRVVLRGTVLDLLNLGGLDLRLKLSGDNLGDLHRLTGVVLPDSPPYTTDGHLIARFQGKAGGRYRYENFNGKIGSSDIHGSLTFLQGKSRPLLTGDVLSNSLRFADLGPLIGFDSGTQTGKQKAKIQSVQPADKVLPYEKFDTTKWATMDADVKFTGKRIEHGKNLPLSDVYTHLKLNDGVLRLDPLRFGMARGNLNASIRLDGNQTPLRGRADVHARRLQLKALFPDVEAMRSSMGQLNGDAQFTGTGNSVAALLGSSNGQVRILMNDGMISRNLMEIAGLNVGNYVVGKLFGDDPVKINCAAADLGIRHGLATPRLFIFDTENAVIKIDGTANFANERLDLSINPNSKGVRIVTLRSPLYVRGTFKHPDAGVKSGPLIARGAAALVLGAVLTPAAALLALIAPSGEENQCAPILREMHNAK
ncbi:AsmA family protein [Acerihabitans sp. TG2]|uniref:AsmA family protein n=1 Tax=Acerihabitans sp. TG2 TaxID=3096008 RepID=UPI002B22E865|nr:AsmA family protein [Acerihabitans sp. TG2]MEA9389906.1 AsmA family protein [Acerihabitans sp. TG2]